MQICKMMHHCFFGALVIPGVYTFMDTHMPEMDGVEAACRVRAGQGGGNTASLPIIAVTANVLESDRETCRKAGINGYLLKPLRPADVENALREMGLVS